MENHFYINSEDREDWNNTNPASFRANLYKQLNPRCIELSFAQIPNTWYNVTLKNNRIWVDDVLYTITPGSYTLNDILQALANSTPLTFAYNDITNKILISGAAIFEIDFSLPFSMNKLLGFKNIFYSGATSYLGTFGPKLYDTAVFISTNLNQGVVMTSPLKNCTFVIPVNTNKSEVVQFYSKTQFSISPKVHEINFLDIRVFDEAGDLLEGMSDWSMMIKIYY